MLKKKEVEEFLSQHSKLSVEIRNKLIRAVGISNDKKEKSEVPDRKSKEIYVRDDSRQSVPLSHLKSSSVTKLGSIVKSPDGLRRKGKTVWIPVKLQK